MYKEPGGTDRYKLGPIQARSFKDSKQTMVKVLLERAYWLARVTASSIVAKTSNPSMTKNTYRRIKLVQKEDGASFPIS